MMMMMRSVRRSGAVIATVKTAAAANVRRSVGSSSSRRQPPAAGTLLVQRASSTAAMWDDDHSSSTTNDVSAPSPSPSPSSPSSRASTTSPFSSPSTTLRGIPPRAAAAPRTSVKLGGGYLSDLIDEYASKAPTCASLQHLMRTGRGELLGKSYMPDALAGTCGHKHKHKQRRAATERVLLQVSGFLRQEIPIRLAHRIRDLDHVPYVRDMPSVQTVRQIYVTSFREMVHFPVIRTAQHEHDFAEMLSRLYRKHSSVLVQMARGAYELREAVRSGTLTPPAGADEDEKASSFERMLDCHDFLDRFYMSRIGVRVLAGQYLALRGVPVPDYVGLICQKTSPFEAVRAATEDAAGMCKRRYGRAPVVQLDGRLDLTFPYIPTYLHYVLLELLKNAMRATAEEHAAAATLPAVTVIIADGRDNEDVVIKIADEGGGIARSNMDKIWSYLFTTADPNVQESMILNNHNNNNNNNKTTTAAAKAAAEDHSNESPMAGLGYGLPISRSYCRYFGGDLDIISMEGYGTDAFVHLKRLGDSKEPVPV